MIDLHLHFDGSLLPRTILDLAKEQGVELPAQEPDELKLFLTAPEDCKSLNEYLEKFDLPLLVLQTKEALRRGMYTLASSLKEQGMLYAEVRFAPQLHQKKGLTQEEVVKAAVLGMQEALAGSFFKANLILCCMRGETTGRPICRRCGRRLLFWGAVWQPWIWQGRRPSIPQQISGRSLPCKKAWGSLYHSCRGSRRTGEYPGGSKVRCVPYRTRGAGAGG